MRFNWRLHGVHGAFLVAGYGRAMKHTSRSNFAILFAAVLAVVFGVPAKEKFDNGSLVWAVHDSSGEAMGGATVTATQASTGVVAKTTTNGTGDYEFPDLKAGVYSVLAEANGFSAARATDINVSV